VDKKGVKRRREAKRRREVKRRAYFSKIRRGGVAK
jgi:hypothetical protein